MIAFKCSGCPATFSVKDEFAGRSTKCPKCGTPLRVPPASAPAVVPVAAVAPNPPPDTRETMKCPFCAEVILKQATKCRFCGEALTKAVKMGFPSFYEDVAKEGLSWEHVLWDYGDFLWPDDSIGDCGLSAGNPIGWLFENQDEPERSIMFQKCMKLIKAMRKRIEELDEARSQQSEQQKHERLLLRALSEFLQITKDYAMPAPQSSLINDPGNLQASISSLEELKASLAAMPSHCWQGFDEVIDHGIRDCKSQLQDVASGNLKESPLDPDCEHEWYNVDGVFSRCYHCRALRKGQFWR